MQYRVEWGNTRQTVIIQTYNGNWTADSFIAIAEESKKLAESVPHTVHIVIDGRNFVGIPRVRVSHFAPLIEVQVPVNQGIVVCVGVHEFIKSLVNIAGMIAPRATRNLYFVRTMEQAWSLLQKEAGVEPPSLPTA
jgi:hypothetical protein